MKNEPLEEKDFPEALEAFMAVHGELIHAVVLQPSGEEPEFLAQGGFRAGFFWDSADDFPMYTIGQGHADQILWIKWEVMGQTWDAAGPRLRQGRGLHGRPAVPQEAVEGGLTKRARSRRSHAAESPDQASGRHPEAAGVSVVCASWTAGCSVPAP